MAKIYQKIPGLGTGHGGLQVAARSRLYTAPDHLLILQSTGYTEEYKRIFFRDILCIDVRKTKVQLWIGIISGAFTLLMALLYFLGLPLIAVVLFCLPSGLGFVVNLVRGPTCECSISTHVQTLKLPTPRREKKVATLINFLRAHVAAATPAAVPQPAS